MNQSFDYAALVEQHLADERMARQLQQRELQNQHQAIQDPQLGAIMEEEGDDDEQILIDSNESNDEPNAFFGTPSPYHRRQHHQFYDDEAVEGEPESPSTESEPPGEDLNDREDAMEDDSILDHYDESFIDDANATTTQNQTFDNTFGLEEEEEEEVNDLNGTIHIHSSGGLSLNQLRNLPKSIPTPFQRTSGKSCAICMESFRNAKIMTLPCFHIFHYNCIKSWFEKSHICPECRADARC